MKFSNAPTYMPVTFASGAASGDRNTIPVPSQQSTTPGAASFTDGFPPITFQPLSSGGVPPFGADFNGILNAVSAGVQWNQAGGVYQYNATFAGAAPGGVGGYPAGALLMRADGNGYWLNLTDGNATNPDTGGAGWSALRANIGTSTIAMVAGNNTPALNAIAAGTLLLTGALSAAASLLLPLTAGASWIVANNTTGTGTVSIGGTTGAAVAIPQAASMQVYTDGTNFYAISAPTTGQYLPINGTAVAATQLATPRTFSITGMATAPAVDFDGTGNVVLNVTGLNAVTAVTVANANGVSASVANQGTTPALTLSLGAITPSSVSCTGASSAASYSTDGDVTSKGVATTADGILNAGAMIRVGAAGATGANTNYATLTGQGIEQVIAGGQGYISAYDRTADAAIQLNLAASSIVANCGVTATTWNATASDRRLKRDIKKREPRPLHRKVPYVGYIWRANRKAGIGSIAQSLRKVAPEHVHEFKLGRATRLNIDYGAAAYEQSMWAGGELDRQANLIEKQSKLIAKLEARLAKLERRA